MTRLKAIATESLNFRKGLMQFREKVKIQLTWIESNSKFSEHLPQKTSKGIKIEMALLEFCRKASVRLNNEIAKTLKKCDDFYKKIHQVHDKCHLSWVAKITDLPSKDHHMVHLQDTLKEDIQYIQKIEVVNEEDINTWVG